MADHPQTAETPQSSENKILPLLKAGFKGIKSHIPKSSGGNSGGSGATDPSAEDPSSKEAVYYEDGGAAEEGAAVGAEEAVAVDVGLEEDDSCCETGCGLLCDACCIT